MRREAWAPGGGRPAPATALLYLIAHGYVTERVTRKTISRARARARIRGRGSGLLYLLSKRTSCLRTENNIVPMLPACLNSHSLPPSLTVRSRALTLFPSAQQQHPCFAVSTRRFPSLQQQTHTHTARAYQKQSSGARNVHIKAGYCC